MARRKQSEGTGMSIFSFLDVLTGMVGVLAFILVIFALQLTKVENPIAHLLRLEGDSNDLSTTFFIEAKKDWVMLVPEGLAAKRNALLMGSGFDRLLNAKISIMDEVNPDREVPINVVILIRGDESLEVFTRVRRLLRSKDVTMGYQFLQEDVDTNRETLEAVLESSGEKIRKMQDDVSIQPDELAPVRYPDVYLQNGDGSFQPLARMIRSHEVSQL